MSIFRRMVFLLCLAMICLAEVTVSNVKAVPRWPWNGKVDITFNVSASAGEAALIFLQGYDRKSEKNIDLQTIIINGRPYTYNYAGFYAESASHTVVWDASKDCPELYTPSMAIKVTAIPIKKNTYLVVDLETGTFRSSASSPNLSDDTCRTTELWLRWIPAGTFTMGSPEDELGRESDEVQHKVTLTEGYYIGVFEVTQKQWELLMGGNPSAYKGDTRPVEYVSYNDIRGRDKGVGWPTGGHAVDEGSFLEKLRSKTGLAFDLPTEAQWEYACRAGTTTALNSGKNLTAVEECPNMAEVGRYWYNRSDGKGGYDEHTKVGSYLPNAWGLYDMHGNVWEWCLDWCDYPASAVTDPQGAVSGSYRVERGGSWYIDAQLCRSAGRSIHAPSYRDFSSGFRVVLVP